ncbi:MAG: DinB family protein [Candidatus Zixiibacteriota bacterium]
MQDVIWKQTVWRQFGASIDMLENAINACPDEVWTGKRGSFYDFWYLASHTIFWLDFYLEERREDFAPPKPFGMEELDPAGVLPPRVYTKDELLKYLDHARQKCRKAILAMTEESANRDCGSKRPGLTNLELLLYSLRHVQHHTAQLNLILRQSIDSAPGWVGKTKIGLEG